MLWRPRKRRHWAILAAVVLVALAAVFGRNDKTATTTAVPTEPTPAQRNPNPHAITGKITGIFADCLTCLDDDLATRVGASDVWCAWKDGTVVIHTVMTNNSIDHVTVQWQPIYTILDGGQHGDAPSALQSVELDAGETRTLLVSQSPKGVAPGAPLGLCAPAYLDITPG